MSMILAGLLAASQGALPGDALVGGWTFDGPFSLQLEPNGLGKLWISAVLWSADEKAIHFQVLSDKGEVARIDAPYELSGERMSIAVDLERTGRPQSVVLKRTGGPRLPRAKQPPEYLGHLFARSGATLFRAARTLQSGFISLTSTQWEAVPSADAASFRPLGLDVGVDRRAVFCPQLAPGLDPKSLRQVRDRLYVDGQGALVIAGDAAQAAGQPPCQRLYKREGPAQPRRNFEVGALEWLGQDVIRDSAGSYRLVPGQPALAPELVYQREEPGLPRPRPAEASLAPANSGSSSTGAAKSALDALALPAGQPVPPSEQQDELTREAVAGLGALFRSEQSWFGERNHYVSEAGKLGFEAAWCPDGARKEIPPPAAPNQLVGCHFVYEAFADGAGDSARFALLAHGATAASKGRELWTVSTGPNRGW